MISLQGVIDFSRSLTKFRINRNKTGTSYLHKLFNTVSQQHHYQSQIIDTASITYSGVSSPHTSASYVLVTFANAKGFRNI